MEAEKKPVLDTAGQAEPQLPTLDEATLKELLETIEGVAMTNPSLIREIRNRLALKRSDAGRKVNTAAGNEQPTILPTEPKTEMCDGKWYLTYSSIEGLVGSFQQIKVPLEAATEEEARKEGEAKWKNVVEKTIAEFEDDKKRHIINTPRTPFMDGPKHPKIIYETRSAVNTILEKAERPYFSAYLSETR
jgi:hypothetical protein